MSRTWYLVWQIRYSWRFNMEMSLACILLILSKSDSLHMYHYLAQLEMSLIVSSNLSRSFRVVCWRGFIFLRSYTVTTKQTFVTSEITSVTTEQTSVILPRPTGGVLHSPPWWTLSFKIWTKPNLLGSIIVLLEILKSCINPEWRIFHERNLWKCDHCLLGI